MLYFSSVEENKFYTHVCLFSAFLHVEAARKLRPGKKSNALSFWSPRHPSNHFSSVDGMRELITESRIQTSIFGKKSLGLYFLEQRIAEWSREMTLALSGVLSLLWVRLRNACFKMHC